jgi:hypothetical protein
MAKLDFAKAKADIVQIIDIVKTVPEPLQLRCFELLFEAAFNEIIEAPTKPEPEPTSAEVEKPVESKGEGTTKKLPSNVLAFSHRHSVTREEIGKLFMIEHDPLLPVYKIPTDNIAKAQLVKVMMVLLENGLLNNALSAPFTELREAVREDGFFEKNFVRNLRRNASMFRGAIREDDIDEDGTVELTGEGMVKLAEIIKELAK